MIPRDLEDRLRAELEPGERVLWRGQPVQGVRFTWTDLWNVPFSIVWLGFVLFWMVSAGEADAAFALVGVPFVLIGVFAVIGRFFVDARARSQMLYAITTRRTIILSGLWSRITASHLLTQTESVDLVERRDGLGDVVFRARTKEEASMSKHLRISGLFATFAKDTSAFVDVPNPREPYDVLRRAFRERDST